VADTNSSSTTHTTKLTFEARNDELHGCFKKVFNFHWLLLGVCDLVGGFEWMKVAIQRQDIGCIEWVVMFSQAILFNLFIVGIILLPWQWIFYPNGRWGWRLQLFSFNFLIVEIKLLPWQWIFYPDGHWEWRLQFFSFNLLIVGIKLFPW